MSSFITIIITLAGIDKIKPEKKGDNKKFRTRLLSATLHKNDTKIAMAPQF